MPITLSVGATTVNLPEDLYWADEFTYSPVEQTSQRSITGALVVSAAERIQGRPITLQPDSDSAAWMRRTVLEQLRNWAAEPGRQMTLTLRGTGRTVIFRHHDGSAIEATPIVHFNDTDGGDMYLVTLRFMEV